MVMLCLEISAARLRRSAWWLFLQLLQLGAMLIHHPLVMVRGKGRHAVGQQVVVGVAGSHFDDVALFAQIFDIMNEQQFNAAARAFGQTTHAVRTTLKFFLRFGFHGSFNDKCEIVCGLDTVVCGRETQGEV